MSFSEFEEKEYEQPTSLQLLAGSPYLYTPGQVLEEIIGFDAGLFTQHLTFWALWGGKLPLGATINSDWWSGLKRAKVPVFPPFKLNVFIQYKRPYHVTRSSGREWNHWGKEYYRFHITNHQQVALEDLAAGLGHQGLVVYASPAFHTWADLHMHTENGTLVDSSNFSEAAFMSGHSAFTYDSPLRSGIACSEPREIARIDVMKEIRIRCEANTNDQSHRGIWRQLERCVDRVMETYPIESARTFYKSRTQIILGGSEVLEEDLRVVMVAWIKTRVASAMLGVDWRMGMGHYKGEA